MPVERQARGAGCEARPSPRSRARAGRPRAPPPPLIRSARASVPSIVSVEDRAASARARGSARRSGVRSFAHAADEPAGGVDEPGHGTSQPMPGRRGRTESRSVNHWRTRSRRRVPPNSSLAEAGLTSISSVNTTSPRARPAGRPRPSPASRSRRTGRRRCTRRRCRAAEENRVEAGLVERASSRSRLTACSPVTAEAAFPAGVKRESAIGACADARRTLPVELQPEPGPGGRLEAAVRRVDARRRSTSSPTHASAKSLKCSSTLTFGVATAKWSAAAVPTGPQTLCGASSRLYAWAQPASLRIAENPPKCVRSGWSDIGQPLLDELAELGHGGARARRSQAAASSPARTRRRPGMSVGGTGSSSHSGA